MKREEFENALKKASQKVRGQTEPTQLDRIEAMLEEILPVVRTLGKLLVRSHEAGKKLGLNKDTIAQNKKITKYEELGHKRTYIEVGELQVVKKRRKK